MHIIRLRHPWQAAWRDQLTDHALTPLRSHTTERFRAAHYSRQFHRPSGLNEQQAVTLILQPTDSVSLVLRPNENFPLSVPAATHKPAASDTKPSRAEVTCTIAIHAILLNSQPLLLSAATNDDELITHISVRVDSILEPFNQLEIVCSIAGSESIDSETAADQDIDSYAATPPALIQWAEVRLEIDD